VNLLHRHVSECQRRYDVSPKRFHDPRSARHSHAEIVQRLVVILRSAANIVRRNLELRAIGEVEATQVNVKLLVGNIVEHFKKLFDVASIQHVSPGMTLRPFADEAKMPNRRVVDVGQERWPMRKRVSLTENIVALQRLVVVDDKPEIGGGFAPKVSYLLFVDDNDVGLPDVIDPVDFLVVTSDYESQHGSKDRSVSYP